VLRGGGGGGGGERSDGGGTRGRFIDNPYYDPSDVHSSKKLYRTGDKVRRLADGNLEFIGRFDEQVKIRGFRIELAEVEKQLVCIEDVADAAVTVNESHTGDKRLIGYIVPSIEVQTNNSCAFIESIRQELKVFLPEYMQPSIIVILDALPLTINGKVDKKSLPAPDMNQQINNYVEPRNEMEHILCEIWGSILGLDKVSVTENFFDLGGHSLLAMRMLTRLESEIGVEVSISTFFMYPDIASIAAYLDAIKLMPENIADDNVENLEEGLI